MSSSIKYWISRYKIQARGIVHAGAHLVQERDLYQELNLEPVLWVEAHPRIAHEAKLLLENYPNQKLVNAALWSKSEQEITLSEAGNEGSSSSLLELGLITGSHPQVVCTNQIKIRTKTLDEVLSLEGEFVKDINFLCVDTQGAEAEVIKGLGNRLNDFNYVLAEVSIRRLYKGATLFDEFTQLLLDADFRIIASNINQNTGWGDALYIRSGELLRLGISEGDYEHVVTNQGVGFATKIRYLMLRAGIPNKLVAKFSRWN
jgi:FkbM family methyltransferase